MIEIIPCISISQGQCAKLTPQHLDKSRLYEKTPLDLAKYFEDGGIKKIHIIDLDGAIEGRLINYHTLKIIAGYTDLTINYSGGIRTEGDVHLAFEYGASTVSVSSLAATEPDTFSSWLISFGRNKLVLAADIINKHIAVSGWSRKTNVEALPHIQYFADRGIQYVKCTDIARDGGLDGPSFEMYENLVQQFPNLKILASGGVQSINDIERLQQIGVHSVVIAKAFYESKLTIADIARFVS